MSHWLLEQLGAGRQQALKQASRSQIYRELLDTPYSENMTLMQRTAEALQLVVLDLALDGANDDEEKLQELKLSAADAFRLLRVLPRPEHARETAMFLLRACTLGVLGDKGSDAARWLREEPWPELPLESSDWSERTWATILDVWLRLVRKGGWTDRDTVLGRIASLRESQTSFEKDYLDGQDPAHAKAVALELIGLYHLAKAAEVFAHYITDGVVEGKYQIHQLLETHFDRVLAACAQAQMIELEPLSRLLAAGALQMADNSIWVRLFLVGGRISLCGSEAGGNWIRHGVVREQRRGPVADGTCAVSDGWGCSAGTRALGGGSQYASMRRRPVAA